MPGLPPVAVVEAERLDADGLLWARPLKWEQEVRPPAILIQANTRPGQALGVGDRALVKLERREPELYEAKLIKVLPRSETPELIGLIEDGAIVPLNKGARDTYRISKAPEGLGVQEGDLVRFSPLRRGRNGPREARLIEVMGQAEGVASIAPLTLLEEGVTTAFPAEALAEAEAAGAPTPEGREDLRHLPFVTIDGADAKDFDDAVQAEPLGAAGYRVRVAIADVAAYVLPGSALDREARDRGNSIYLPDRVVPMLPEALSNGWCSLNPDEDRGALVAVMEIDAAGQLKVATFQRALIRSKARLTYRQVQAHLDGETTLAQTELHPALEQLVGANAALTRAREARGTLALDLPEYRAELDVTGTRVLGMQERRQGSAHLLIENCMILANVAAARALAAKACLYRVHEAPDSLKLEQLRLLSRGTPAALKRGEAVSVPRLNALLAGVAEDPDLKAILTEATLRAQAQAAYRPDNLGHFGLGLPAYAHFTSPIRRYADLAVHRALIAHLGLAGPGGQAMEVLDPSRNLGPHLGLRERRAMAIERRAHERYAAAYYAERQDAPVRGRVSGANRAGLFVSLPETGASAFVPVANLGETYLSFDAAYQRFWEADAKGSYGLGDVVTLQLVEANSLTGGLTARLSDHKLSTLAPARPSKTAKIEARKSGPVGKKKHKTRGHPKHPGKARHA